jgi:protein gp37
MGKATDIAYTDRTFNPWWGCSAVSEGCLNCYAKRISLIDRNEDLWQFNGRRRSAHTEGYWSAPLQWERASRRTKRRDKVLCQSMGDFFEDHHALGAPRERTFGLITKTPHLDWMLITKHPENILAMIPDSWLKQQRFPDNVWLIVTVENMKRAEERHAHLLALLQKMQKPKVLALSVEPMLERIDLSGFESFVDWVIVGGEGGLNARPFYMIWAYGVERWCRKWGKLFFFKQWGDNAPDRPAGCAYDCFIVQDTAGHFVRRQEVPRFDLQPVQEQLFREEGSNDY